MQSRSSHLGAFVDGRAGSIVSARAVSDLGLKRRSAVLLMGPTGSGKSDLAVRLAEQLPLEIISVDSALGDRGMDIGTAKPSLSTRERVRHHFTDIRDAGAGYSVGEFLLDARQAMLEVWSRGRQPLLVGG